MFSELNDYLEENKFNQKNVKQSVISHLRNLSQRFNKYFPKVTTPQQHDWILSPFTISNYNSQYHITFD